MDDSQYVFHGSHEIFEEVIPKQNKRIRKSRDTGEEEIIFDEVSFHATPYKWIAIAYIAHPTKFEMDGIRGKYSMGVDLYDHKKELIIYGAESLEKSLEALYGAGGYVYWFNKSDFYHKNGLGNLEVIIQKNIRPYKIEHIIHPVEELKKEGVEFIFKDLALPENEKYRNSW